MKQGSQWMSAARCAAAGVAYAWPLWFVAQSLVNGVPALLTAALSEWTLAMVSVRPDGVLARVFAPGAATADYQPGMSEATRDPFGLSLILTTVVVLLLLRAGRRWQGCWHMGPLAAAWIALALLQVPARALWFGREPLDAIALASLAFALPLTFATLRALARRTASGQWATRIAVVTIQVGIPFCVLPLFWGRGLAWEQAMVQFALLIPLLAAACWNAGQQPSQSLPPGARMLAAGIAASLCVFVLGSGFQPARVSPQSLPGSARAAMPPDSPYPRLFFQRGVSFTSEWPASYQSPEAHALLGKLREQGVDAIALVPYGVTRRGSDELRFGGWERDDSLVALTNTAHSLGMRVMLKPQVWIRGSYPGDFDLPDEEARRKWFAQYEELALHYAELAARTHADLFCVGTEFAKLTRHEDYWRQLIAKVRTVYPGPVTYAANFGEEFESLAFWDAVDYIGLNNYYPLPDNFDVSPQLARVEAVQARFGKPVIFTEAGYSSYENGHRKPWSEEEGPVDLEMQARAYETILAAYWGKPWFYGAYWWKIGSNSFGGPTDRSHTPWGKPAMAVLRGWYKKPDATR